MWRTATALAVVLAVALGVWAWQATRPVPDAPSGEPLVAVTLPPLGPVEEAGKAAFEANCATCHGANAAGRDGIGPPLVHVIYEPSHHGDAAFLLAARQGVRAHHWPFGNMAPVEGVSDAEIAAIVAYVRALQRANGIF